MKRLFYLVALVTVAAAFVVSCQKYDDGNLKKDYLTFEAVEAGAKVSMRIQGNCEAPTLEFSTNKLDWTRFDFDNPQTIVLENVGDKVYWRNVARAYHFSPSNSKSDFVRFVFGDKKIAASGSIMSLLDKDCNLDVIPEGITFAGLFVNDTSLVSSPELPAKWLSSFCYYSMFANCKSLETAPKLPAKNLAQYCYNCMFFGCSALKEAPELPAETLVNDCYYQMFDGCSSLTKTPILPAMKAVSECYVYMFHNCTSLVEVPALPATEVERFCYYGMFWNCTSLKEAPALPATKLSGEDCYGAMFEECTSLKEAPELPATELAEGCYYSMFDDCYSLEKAPALPAMELTPYCYQYMFNRCFLLGKAPELPAMELAPYCYQYMFSECYKLEKAPELPATTLFKGCYEGIFDCCSSMNHIKVAFEDWNDGTATSGWVAGVGAEGTFECPEGLAIQYGDNFIPNGWSVSKDGNAAAPSQIAPTATASSFEIKTLSTVNKERPELIKPEFNQIKMN